MIGLTTNAEDEMHDDARALAAQATQTAGLIAAMGVDCYTAWVSDESFVEVTAAPDRCQAALARSS